VRIAIDGRELAGRPTGVGRYLSELLTAWSELPAARAHEFVLCLPERVDEARFRGLHLGSVISPGMGTIWEQRTLPTLVVNSGADVLFSPAYTCPLWCRVPTVLVIHDVSFAAHPEWFSWREGLRRRTLTRLSANHAARVITDTEFSRREITRLLAIPASRIEVIYLGASSLNEPTPSPAAIGIGASSLTQSTQSREPIVLYVGSLFTRRHIPELIEGFRRVAARALDARLEIVGDNRSKPPVDVERLIASTGLADRMHWRSYVSDAELAALYGRASAFAFLSDYEGFGLTPIEAMSAGLPIVVLDTEIARDVYGDAARYVARPDPDLIAAALEQVLSNASERTRLLDAGARQLQRYSWRACAERTLQVLLTAR
jgi:glycosyltransferase involved in cell wall biosynthesis